MATHNIGSETCKKYSSYAEKYISLGLCLNYVVLKYFFHLKWDSHFHTDLFYLRQ